MGSLSGQSNVASFCYHGTITLATTESGTRNIATSCKRPRLKISSNDTCQECQELQKPGKPRKIPSSWHNLYNRLRVRSERQFMGQAVGQCNERTAEEGAILPPSQEVSFAPLGSHTCAKWGGAFLEWCTRNNTILLHARPV